MPSVNPHGECVRPLSGFYRERVALRFLFLRSPLIGRGKALASVITWP